MEYIGGSKDSFWMRRKWGRMRGDGRPDQAQRETEHDNRLWFHPQPSNCLYTMASH
jgi:hypothetical protein